MLSKPNSFNKLNFIPALLLTLVLLAACGTEVKKVNIPTNARTVAGLNREFGEPFGLAIDRNGDLYVSDGAAGRIFRVSRAGRAELVSDKFNTPSALAFDRENDLIVADSGTSTIRRLNLSSGEVTTVAGVENKRGFADGEAGQALFNSPVGVTTAPDGKIYLADTYNDRIRLIENGKVSTLAGNARGFADGPGTAALFDTPSGLTLLPDGSLVVADTGNRRLRRLDGNGNVTTIAGTGERDAVDAFPLAAAFVEPTSVSVDPKGALYVADGNSVRAIGRRAFPVVETITGSKRGYADGELKRSRFNRVSGVAVDNDGNIYVADAENQVIRVLTGENVGKQAESGEIAKLRFNAGEFRELQPPRWTYDPPAARRDIAGTLGEIRGEVRDDDQVWFHNGLDIAGGYGEKAYFIRSEKVLRPLATENFGGLRELVRMPTIGYIHLRLGRDKNDRPFGDDRFLFERSENGKPVNVRIPRGVGFVAGDALGTLNAFNHVHLIAGRSGAEMNALDALRFPNISDKIQPKIEKISFFSENWSPIETVRSNGRIKLGGKIRLTVQAFDRMDGNPERRKLGVYRLGYQLFRDDKTPLFEPKWTISFEKMPDPDFVRLVYARGSKSGYTPETVFDYIVTNEVLGDYGRENFLDLNSFETGNYILRVLVSDLFGNTTTEDISFELVR